MKTNKKTPKQRNIEKNRLAKIERNKKRRESAKRKMKFMAQAEEQGK